MSFKDFLMREAKRDQTKAIKDEIHKELLRIMNYDPVMELAKKLVGRITEAELIRITNELTNTDIPTPLSNELWRKFRDVSRS